MKEFIAFAGVWIICAAISLALVGLAIWALVKYIFG